MTIERPRVLIFDDDEDWADQIAISIQNRCDTSALTTITNWKEAVSSAQWDVIVVDEQIAGHPKTGTDHAERAILEHKITSPIIVISGVWLLKELAAKNPGMFFGYVSKDNLHDSLPEMIDKACRIDARTDYIKNMTAAFAKKLGILMKEFPLDLLQDTALKRLFESANGRTVADLIGLIEETTRRQLDRIGRNVLVVIDRMRAKPT